MRMIEDLKLNPIDFEVYYLAAQAIAQGENPYFGSGVLQRRYIYPQFLAFCFSPFAKRKIEELFAVWLPLNWLMHLATIAMLVRFSVKAVF